MAGYSGTYSDRNFSYNPNDLRNILESLIDVKELIINHQSDNLRTCKMWCQQRKESIDQLTAVVNQLEEYEANCNSVQLVAETVGAVSDLVCVIGAAMSLFKVKDVGTCGDMMKTGQVVSEIGEITSKGTVLIKEMIIKYKARTAKRILEEDATLTDNLGRVLQPSHQFYRLVNEIMDFEVFLSIMNSYRNNRWNTRRIRKSRGEKNRNQTKLPHDVETTIELLSISRDQKQCAKKFMKVVLQSHDIFNMFNQLADIGRNNSFVFSVLELFNNLSFFDVVHDIQQVLSLAYTDHDIHNMGVSTRNDVLGQGIVSAVRFLNRVEKLENTAKMISNKEASEFTKKLKEVLKIMQKELDDFEEKYNILLQNIFNNT